jgi:large subunit ribosomal protein L24
VKLKIRKGATVQVISGADKGKKGSVLEVDPTGLKLKVQGVKIMTHFDKKDGLKKLESFINYSNVKLVEQAPIVKAKKVAKTTKKSASKTV